MKVHYHGSPELFEWLPRLAKWALGSDPSNRMTWKRLLAIIVLAVLIGVCWPVAWVLVKLGNVGHWLAYGALGKDSHSDWS